MNPLVSALWRASSIPPPLIFSKGITHLARTRALHGSGFHTSVKRCQANDYPSPAEIAPLLDEFAHHPARPLTLSTLLSFGRPLTPESVLNSVEQVRTEIPRLFVRRVRALEDLPFIVGMNPFIARTLAAHRRSFQLLATYPSVTSLEDNVKFTEQLEILVRNHANDIPIMAKG